MCWIHGKQVDLPPRPITRNTRKNGRLNLPKDYLNGFLSFERSQGITIRVLDCAIVSLRKSVIIFGPRERSNVAGLEALRNLKDPSPIVTWGDARCSLAAVWNANSSFHGAAAVTKLFISAREHGKIAGNFSRYTVSLRRHAWRAPMSSNLWWKGL